MDEMKNATVKIECDCDVCEGTGSDWYRRCFQCGATGRVIISVSLKELAELLHDSLLKSDQG